MTLLTPERIQELLDISGIGVDAVFFDDMFAQVDKHWIETVLKDSFNDFRARYKIAYNTQAFDCENFSRLYANWADILHSRTPGHPVSGIAIGTFAFTRDDGLNHAINIAICNNGEVVFIEPQSGNIIQLSDNEKWNALDCRF